MASAACYSEYDAFGVECLESLDNIGVELYRLFTIEFMEEPSVCPSIHIPINTAFWEKG